MPPPTLIRASTRWSVRFRMVVAAGAVILPLLLSAASCASRPTYDPVPADLCDDVAPLLTDLLVAFQVTLQDEVLGSHLDQGLGESTHCYFRAGGMSTFVTLLMVTKTYPSAEDAEHSHQRTVAAAPGRGYEPVGSVDGVGEQAEAFLRELDSGGPLTLYHLAGRDRNLSFFMELEVQDDRHPTTAKLTDLMTPLALEVLELLPES